MNRVLRTDHGSFELVTGAPSRADGGSRLRFLDADEALRLLQVLAAEPLARMELRVWAEEIGCAHVQDGPMLAQLAARLADGRLGLLYDDRLPSGSSPGVPGGEPGTTPGRRPSGPPPPGPPRPPPVPEIITELLVRVKTEDGEPVAEANVSAGALGDRPTDEHGVANYGRVRPGTYDVSAEKPGHAPRRRRRVRMDEKKKVEVPAGSRTEVDLVQHPQCPNVACFEGPDCRPSYSGESRQKYFAFDHTTNVARRRRLQYWVPIPNHGNVDLPEDRLTRDGTRWVSLAVGREVELEIHFDFRRDECIPCIANTTFELEGDNVAEVVTTSVTGKKAAFKFKGMAEGEATLFAVCDGDRIGRFHIWCQREATIKVDLVRIVTRRASLPNVDAASVESFLNDVFRQAVLKISLLDLDSVDLSDSDAFAAAEDAGYPSPPGGGAGPVPFNGAQAVGEAIHEHTERILSRRTTEEGGEGKVPRNGAYRIYYYVPNDGAGYRDEHGEWRTLLGYALEIGSRVCLTVDTGDDHEVTTAHELGHCLRLRHPAHDRPEHRNDSVGAETGNAAQFLEHNWSTSGQRIRRDIDATNTEPMVPKQGGAFNVMANDPLNLMGYYWNQDLYDARLFPVQLRYLQWKAARRD